MIGKSLPSSHQSAQIPSATEPGAQPEDDLFLVPDWLVSAPAEWRTESGEVNRGYAILLDHNRRELLVEQCVHLGYFDIKANLPKKPSGLNCTRVLTGTLLEFTGNDVSVMKKDGAQTEVSMTYTEREGIPTLDLQFSNHSMRLVPGQTNDLAQEFEASPSVKTEYAKLYNFEQQQMRQERAKLATVDNSEVPRFSLPAKADKQAELEERRQGEPAEPNL